MNAVRFKLPSREGLGLLFADLLILLVTPAIALAIRLDGELHWDSYGHQLWHFAVSVTLLQLAALAGFSLYRCAWKYAGARELGRVVASIALANLAMMLLVQGLDNEFPQWFGGLPRSLSLLNGLVSSLSLLGLRLLVRTVSRRLSNSIESNLSKASVGKLALLAPRNTTLRSRALIVGAGEAGMAFVCAAWRDPKLALYPVAFLDDDASKHNLVVRGVPVLGGRQQLPEVVHQQAIDKIIIAMPTAPGSVIREIVQLGQSLEIPTQTLPSLHELLTRQGRVDQTRELRLEDLLRRDPIQTDVDQVRTFLRGKRVLVTGAGGSIGSEICRQVLRANPSEIILLGKGENSIFLIQQELRGAIAELQSEGELIAVPKLEAIIADIRSRKRLEYAFQQYCPDVIFHAAAHKHVPLMELNPPEAITVNVIGTKNLIDLAITYGVPHFVMISTDKAVNPTNIMGASKRMAEMIVLQAAKRYKRSYNVVRFGNVLGSRGSVVPTFRKQIALGGPITITHPEICRYFMTIPEAVQLVLQSSVLGKGGAVFMMDMGEPVKIVDLAKDLVRLAGLRLGEDIELAYSGLRPGEKLYEELFVPGENYERTCHQTLLTVPNASRQLPQTLDAAVLKLVVAASRHDYASIVALLKSNVTGYQPKANGLGRLETEVSEHSIEGSVPTENDSSALQSV